MTLDPDWIWSARRGVNVHLADPTDASLTLCGITAEHQASEYRRRQPAFRCQRCARIKNKGTK